MHKTFFRHQYNLFVTDQHFRPSLIYEGDLRA
jgi:hypothetical protein